MQQGGVDVEGVMCGVNSLSVLSYENLSIIFEDEILIAETTIRTLLEKFKSSLSHLGYLTRILSIFSVRFVK